MRVFQLDVLLWLGLREREREIVGLIASPTYLYLKAMTGS